MTELAINEAPAQSAAVAYLPAAAPGSSVDLSGYWDRMGIAINIATSMCKTPFVPSAFRNKPEDTAMAIMYGLKYGMEPDAALSSIFIIGGSPGMYSRVQHALLLAHGHDVQITKQSPQECIVKGRRKGSEGDWTTSVWTTERAQIAGYFSNAKYKTDPIAMLTARALGDVCRLVAPDLLMGIVAYNEADVEVMEVIDGDTLRPMAQEPVRVQRRSPAPITPPAAVSRPFVDVSAQQPPAAAPAPQDPAPLAGEDKFEEEQVDYDDGVMDEAPAPAAAPVEESNVVKLHPGGSPVAMASELQITTMIAELNRAGARTIAAKRSAVSEWAGRSLGGFNDLTADEADQYINHLMMQNAEAPTRAAVDAEWGITNNEEGK